MNLKERWNNRKVSQSGLVAIRIIAGGYVANIAFDLIKNRATSDVAPEVLIPLSVILLVAGGLICIVSVVDLFQGRYVGGKGDPEVIEATRIAMETQNASDSFGNPKTDEEAETEK